MKKIYHNIALIFILLLTTALAQPFSTQTLNNIITHQKISADELVTINFSQHKNTAGVFQLRNSKLGIANIYTLDAFKQLYPKKLEAAAKQIKQPALLETYLAQYAKSWLAFLNNIKLVKTNAPQQLLTLVNRLASNNSPLTQINTLYRSNMTPSVADLNQELKAFYNLPTMNAPYNLTQLRQLFVQLQNYLKPLNGASPQEGAFQLATARMNNHGEGDPISKLYEVAQVAPPPLRHWLYQLAQNTWEVLLNNAQQYINQQWVRLAIPFNQEFSQTFPFDSMASQQANMNNFVNDFAPDGMFDNFMTRYLKPFVSTYQKTWAVKNLNGYGLRLSNATLQTLQTISTIQNLFFPNGDTHIRIPFSLESLSVPTNIKTIIVKIGKQTFSYSSPKQIAKLMWPNLEDINGTTSIQFIDKQGKKTTFSGVGPWGWWQVLKQAEIKPSDQDQAWVAIFKVGGQNAQMAFYTNTTENPFDLNRFSNFRLPNQLG